MSKTILITGSSRGIGRAISLLAAERKFNIIINYHQDKKSAEQTKELVEREGSKAIVIQADVSNYDSVKNMVSKGIETFGTIDILVNSAGILSVSDIEDEDISLLHKLIDVNVKGVINTIHALVPSMKNQGEGKIINIASMAGISGIPGYATYCASKFAVNGLTESLGEELTKKGIEIYSVCPGAVNTDMIKDLPFEGMPPEKVAHRVFDILEGRIKLSPGGISELPS